MKDNPAINLYYKCSDCSKILSAYEPSLCCNSSTAYFLQWPSPLIKEMLRFIARQDLGRYSEQHMAILNIHTILQMLLEESILTLSKKCSRNNKNIDTDFFKNLSREMQIKFFDAMSIRPVAVLLEAEGFGWFMEKWKIICDVRDKLVYEPNEKLQADYSELITLVSSSALKIFASINNDLLRVPEKQKVLLKRSVMVVDDEEDVRVTLSDILEKEGVRVLEAASGEEAITLYRDSKPDLVFLDVSLPKMNGLAVLKNLIEFDNEAKVYFVSGVAGEHFMQQVKQLGAKGYLPKPFYSKDIVNLLREEFA